MVKDDVIKPKLAAFSEIRIKLNVILAKRSVQKMLVDQASRSFG